MKDQRIKQRGFTIVSAVFIVVILALIGSYIVSISSLTRTSENLGILGLRTYFAANSGLEWGIYQVTNGPGPYNCPASPTTLNLTQAGLNGFKVVVTCTQNTFIERGKSFKIFEFESFGEFGVVSSIDYTSRLLYARIIQPGF